MFANITKEQIYSTVRLVGGYVFSILAAFGLLPEFLVSPEVQQNVLAYVAPVIHVAFSWWNGRRSSLIAKAAALPEVTNISVADTDLAKSSIAAGDNDGTITKAAA